MEKKELLEAALFVAGDAVPIAELCRWLELERADVDNLLEQMTEGTGPGSGLCIRRIEDTVQLTTKPEYADALRAIFAPPREAKLSQSLLETLTVIAYRQPITRLEVEEIRGVRCVYAITTLLERGLIRKAGHKDVLGRPVLYATTDDFLRQFGLSSLADLPELKEDADTLQLQEVELDL